MTTSNGKKKSPTKQMKNTDLLVRIGDSISFLLWWSIEQNSLVNCSGNRLKVCGRYVAQNVSAVLLPLKYSKIYSGKVQIV